MYLRVSFPSARYYAAETSDPRVPEWPPHPSRLFSALVASAYRSGSGITEHKRKFLTWLESQPPPSIMAPVAELSPACTTYVPPGDSQGRKGLPGQGQYEHGIYRWRQPRTFPSAIIMGEPVVYYTWKVDPEGDLLPVVDEITAGVTHVGTSHSIVLIKSYLGEMPSKPTLSPDPNGKTFLRVPIPGRLKELDSVYEQTAGVRRPTAACEPLVSYHSEQSHFTYDEGVELLTFRVSGSTHGADTSAYLGKALRRAVMSVLGDDVPPAVHGHNGGSHVAWLPLPDVGHSYASGSIIGISIMLPQGLDTEQRQVIIRGLASVHDLRLPDGRLVKLAYISPGERLPVTLLQKTWTQSSTIWATVTPVVLDRPPKKLTDERVCHALCQSLQNAGYPKPQDIRVSKFSMFRGAPPAFRVPAAKPRYHALVRFQEPVVGPLIAGRLRYFGVGLFRPLHELDTGSIP
jgi:CRISPR-associated protein Csb2